MAKLLFVDDNAGFRRSMCRAMRRAGFETDEAGDGEQACEKLGSAQYDLVVTDVFMPKMDGYEFIKALRSSHPDVPVIAVTGGFAGGYTGVLAGQVMEKFGAVSSLQKPVKADNLVEHVKAALNRPDDG